MTPRLPRRTVLVFLEYSEETSQSPPSSFVQRRGAIASDMTSWFFESVRNPTSAALNERTACAPHGTGCYPLPVACCRSMIALVGMADQVTGGWPADRRISRVPSSSTPAIRALCQRGTCGGFRAFAGTSLSQRPRCGRCRLSRRHLVWRLALCQRRTGRRFRTLAAGLVSKHFRRGRRGPSAGDLFVTRCHCRILRVIGRAPFRCRRETCR